MFNIVPFFPSFEDSHNYCFLPRISLCFIIFNIVTFFRFFVYWRNYFLCKCVFVCFFNFFFFFCFNFYVLISLSSPNFSVILTFYFLFYRLVIRLTSICVRFFFFSVRINFVSSLFFWVTIWFFFFLCFLDKFARSYSLITRTFFFTVITVFVTCPFAIETSFDLFLLRLFFLIIFFC